MKNSFQEGPRPPEKRRRGTDVIPRIAGSKIDEIRYNVIKDDKNNDGIVPMKLEEKKI